MIDPPVTLHDDMSKLAQRVYDDAMQRFDRMKGGTGSTRNSDILYCLASTLEDFWPFELGPDEYSVVKERMLFMGNV